MRPLILFSHGAGAGHDHPWMQRWRLRLSDIGEVHSLTYPYMKAGRRLPDPIEKLEAAHLNAVDQLCRTHPRRPLVLAGKSMGARVAVRVADRTPAIATVAFGYPLVSSGKRQTLRDGPLRLARTPTLLVQGTRDPMGPIDLLTDLVADHESESLRLRIVEDGDHSLECRKRPLRARGQTQDDVDDEILYDLGRYLASLS